MKIKLIVCTSDRLTEKEWMSELSKFFRGKKSIEIIEYSRRPAKFKANSIVLLDDYRKSGTLKEEYPDSFFLLVLPTSKQKGKVKVDDHLLTLLPELGINGILTHPFQAVEIFNHLQYFDTYRSWSELRSLNVSFSNLLQSLQQDLMLAERLQKAKAPKKFAGINGISVASRYLAGAKPGGDFFDLAESRDKKHVSIAMTNANTYGLSSAVLSVLLKVALKLSTQEMTSTSHFVQGIHEELLLTLGEKGRLSLFYGTISRQTGELNYLNLGDHGCFFSQPGEGFQELAPQGEAISASPSSLSYQASRILLQPESRLVVLSAGCLEALSGKKSALNLINESKGKDLASLINETVFKIKSSLKDSDDMLSQDCSILALDANLRLIQISPKQASGAGKEQSDQDWG